MSLKRRLEGIQEHLHAGQDHTIIAFVVHYPAGARATSAPGMTKVTDGIDAMFIHLGTASPEEWQRLEQRELRRLRNEYDKSAARPALPKGTD